MSLNDVLSTIDSEITRLQQARALLAGSGSSRPGKKHPIQPTRTRRKLSAEVRKRIADAQRKRWAAQRKAAK